MVTRYYQELLNFLSRAVNNREAAADLAQESYARVLAMQQDGVAIAEPRALLYRTARNLIIDQHRRELVRGVHGVNGVHAEAGHRPDGDDHAPGALNALDLLAAPAALEPETAAMSAQGVQAMLAVIGGLPLRCREAFILHKFDGLSQAAVAQQMGISVTMVERHIQHAMRACRRCVESPPHE